MVCGRVALSVSDWVDSMAVLMVAMQVDLMVVGMDYL
jgi:hypothetical protein